MSNLLLAFALIALIALTACGNLHQQTRPGDFTPAELGYLQRTLK